MKTTYNLLNEAVDMGFNKEKALKDIDACLDEFFGIENRKSLMEEMIPNDLYNDILLGSNVKEKVVNMKITGLKKQLENIKEQTKKVIIVLNMVILCLIRQLESYGQMNFIRLVIMNGNNINLIRLSI